MKKHILFVIDSLFIGGAEKSLTTLLNLLDYCKYEVDLLVFKEGGEFEKFIPNCVNILPWKSIEVINKKELFRLLLSFDLRKIKSKCLYSIQVRKGFKDAREQSRKYWKAYSNCIETLFKEYDVAIAYAQRIPTYFVVDKVKAKKKYGWINTNYVLDGRDKEYQKRFYSKLDGIVLVSKSALNIFADVYPEFKNKMHLIYDINDASFIQKMSDLPLDLPIDDSGIHLLVTVARLNKEHKGYDISLEAARLLRDRGVMFKWYVIGEGLYRNDMESYISQNKLEDYVILLGSTPNPYSYMKKATLYVQTSRHEGFGLSIAEARILNIPVVTTEFEAVYNQMVQGKNGIVVPVDAVAVADAIEDLLNNPQKRSRISEYQASEKKGNIEELSKYYDLIDCGK